MEPFLKNILVLCALMGVVYGQTPPPKHVHHSNSALRKYLLLVNSSYPDITHLYSIGQSTKGQELWVMAIGENPTTEKLLRPSVKYIANVHGNEVVGREDMIQLIDYYVKSYDVNTTITEFLQKTVIHIMPSMNPDGYDIAKKGRCNHAEGGTSANGIGLSFNFPDTWHDNHDKPIQNETQAVMEWLPKHNFVLSANIFGQGSVVNYPFDQYIKSKTKSGPSISPDDDVFQFLSLTFSRSHQTMATNDSCSGFKHGIINGADLFPTAGSIQDFEYIVHGFSAVTLLVSCCRFSKASDLENYWWKSKAAYVNLLLEAHRGVKGVITDENDTVIVGADITIQGRESMPFKSRVRGEYYRILMPGKYTLQVNAKGYHPENKKFTVPEGKVVQVINVTLRYGEYTSEVHQSSVTQDGRNAASISFTELHILYWCVCFYLENIVI